MKSHYAHFVSRFAQTGWNAFRLLWACQSLSLLGTSMTRFGVLIWAYQQEGSVTALALLGFFSCTSFVLVSPFAGVLVDRWDRRKVMFLADLGAGLMTALLLGLYAAGELRIWHLYLAQTLSGAFEAFQSPAFWASVSLVVPRQEYTRANGLLGLGQSAARVLAPAFAGALLPFLGLGAVMTVDLLTLGLALSALLFVRIPRPEASAEGRQAAGSFRHQMAFGFGYILRRPGLRALLGTFFLVNLFAALTYFAVLSPMILARTGGDEAALGLVQMVMGLGGIVGGFLISRWKGSLPKTRIYLVSTALSFLVCDSLTAVSRSTGGWALSGFLAELTIPFISSPYYALWQESVPPDVQGRVFATREMTQLTSQPLGFLAAGLLADRLFEPAMQSGGALAASLGWLIGTGPGAGMAAMFLCTSLFGFLTGSLGLLSPAIRGLDKPLAERTEMPFSAQAGVELSQ